MFFNLRGGIMLIQDNFDLELAQEVNGETEQPALQAASSVLYTAWGGCIEQ